MDWLLEPVDPSVRYRTLRGLLGRPVGDPDAAECRARIPESKPVKAILGKMHPDGYWLQKTDAKFWTGGEGSKMIGDGVEYGSFGTTHYCLSYLAELGLDRSHPQVAKAAERYLNLQKEDGDFLSHFSCLLGLNIRTFTMLGYGDDPRIRKSVGLLLGTERPDGGYLCDMHEGKYKTKPTKSCIRGSVKALLAFSLRPETWSHPRVKVLVDYFLRRGGIYRSGRLGELVNRDMEGNSFPITWRANVYEVLLALSAMGYGARPELEGAWSLLDSRADAGGRQPLDWTYAQAPWKVGARGEANKWVTFYACLAHRYREAGGHPSCSS